MAMKRVLSVDGFVVCGRVFLREYMMVDHKLGPQNTSVYCVILGFLFLDS